MASLVDELVVDQLRSLSFLWIVSTVSREVISKLSKQAQQGEDKTKKKGEKDVYIPWRDSKLTRLLQVRGCGSLSSFKPCYKGLPCMARPR